MSVIGTQDGVALGTESGQALALDYTTASGGIEQFDFSVNLLKALLWQYNEAVTLQAILQAKSDWYDANQTQFWQQWIANVFNLETADEFGLRVWSIILNLPLFVASEPDSLTKPTFGFNDPYFKNFNRGNFSSLTGSTNDLPLETKRLALRLRYFQLCSSGTVPEINRFLAYIFADRGQVYLVDKHNMTQEYHFNFPITSDLQYLFNNFDILPRPTGVSSTYINVTRKCFGFSPFGLNFNNGNFGE